MKYTLSFDIDCGLTTCASEPGKFCRFFRNNLDGSGTCHLFGELFDDESGWIQRHPECIKLAEEAYN